MNLYIEVFKRYCKDKGLSIAKLAKEFNISRQAMSERINNFNLSPQMEKKLARMLGIRISDIELQKVPTRKIKTFLHKEFLRILKQI